MGSSTATRENVKPLLNGVGDLVIDDICNGRGSGAFFTSLFSVLMALVNSLSVN